MQLHYHQSPHVHAASAAVRCCPEAMPFCAVPRIRALQKSFTATLLCSAEKAARHAGALAQTLNDSSVTSHHRSGSSEGSSINSAAAGMNMMPRFSGPQWTQPDSSMTDDPDASDASHAFQPLGSLYPLPGGGFYKPGYEFDPYQADLAYSIGYGSQDQRFHTQADSFVENEADTLVSKKVKDPVSVLPSHLYSTDDEQSTQHVISATSNSAQMQPQASGKDVSLNLPSITDIYAVIDEHQKAVIANKAPAIIAAAGKQSQQKQLPTPQAAKPVQGSPIDCVHTSTSPSIPHADRQPAVAVNPFPEQHRAFAFQNSPHTAGQPYDVAAYGRAGKDAFPLLPSMCVSRQVHISLH